MFQFLCRFAFYRLFVWYELALRQKPSRLGLARFDKDLENVEGMDDPVNARLIESTDCLTGDVVGLPLPVQESWDQFKTGPLAELNKRNTSELVCVCLSGRLSQIPISTLLLSVF